MSAREPSGSGGLAGSPASMQGEVGRRKKSAAAAIQNCGSTARLPTPAAPVPTSDQVAEPWNRSWGWLFHRMLLVAVPPNAPPPEPGPTTALPSTVQCTSVDSYAPAPEFAWLANTTV